MRRIGHLVLITSSLAIIEPSDNGLIRMRMEAWVEVEEDYR